MSLAGTFTVLKHTSTALYTPSDGSLQCPCACPPPAAHRRHRRRRCCHSNASLLAPPPALQIVASDVAATIPGVSPATLQRFLLDLVRATAGEPVGEWGSAAAAPCCTQHVQAPAVVSLMLRGV